MHRLALLVVAALLSSCETSGTSGGTNKAVYNSAAKIDYNLSETEAQIVVELTLHECGSNDFTATPKVSIVSTAGADKKHQFSISGEDLQSFFKERNLAIKLYKHGAIESVNGGAADKTGAIIGNIIKSIVPVASAVLGPPGPSAAGSACNGKTLEALQARTKLKARISTLRLELPTADPSDVKKIQEAINIHALEIARLNEASLRIKLTRQINFLYRGKGTPGVYSWKENQFVRWTGDKTDSLRPDFKISVDISNIPHGDGGGKSHACPTFDASCRKTLVLREPATVEVKVLAKSIGFVNASGVALKTDAELVKKQIPVTQWGAFSYLPIDAGFGESKSFALGLDPYGRKTSFTWKSNARGESITGSLATVTPESAKFIDKISGMTELEAATAEITELETRLKLNKLKRCEDVIIAGGFKCPEE